MNRPALAQGFARAFLALAFLWASASVARAHGPFHDQIRALTDELKARPGDVGLLARRCDIERAHSLWPEALVDLVELERLAPADPTNRLRRGIVMLGQGKPAEALPHLETWLRSHPDGIEERLALAQAYMKAEQWTNAVRELSVVLRNPADARAQVFLDRAFCEQKAGVDPAVILGGLDEGITRLGSPPQLVRLAAEVELARGSVDAGVARIARLAERSERKERWLYEQGELFRRAGRQAEARQCYSNALAALQALPPKFQRSLLSSELRRELEGRLGAGGVQ